VKREDLFITSKLGPLASLSFFPVLGTDITGRWWVAQAHPHRDRTHPLPLPIYWRPASP
jgi:hypothetical protein